MLFLTLVTRCLARRSGSPMRLAGEGAPRRLPHDPLTGLPNGDVFAAECRDAAAEHGGATLVLVELAGLDRIADRHGSGEAERAFAMSARRLRAVVDTGDVVARLTARGLAVLMRGVDRPDNVRAIGQRIVRILEEPVSLERREHRLTPALGATLLSDGDAAAALKRAEHALSRARSTGWPAISFCETGLLAKAA